MIRRSSSETPTRIAHILDKIQLHYADLEDGSSIDKIIREVNPDEIYNLASMSQVRISFDIPVYTGDVTGLGFARILESVRNFNKDIKIYQASSSEMFGKVLETPQKETTPFYPRSPYGCAKAYAFYLGRSYREGYGMKVYNGILFNHESPRRGDTFVSKKVISAAVEIKQGKRDKLYLGNLSAKRDWGSAKDYMEAVYKIMQHPSPDDFVIATGETHTIQEFVEEVFRYLDLDWKKHVVVDENLMRPAEVDLLQGDYSKAERLLGWTPSMKFKDVIKWMCDEQLLQK